MLRVIPDRLGAHPVAARVIRVPTGPGRAALRHDAEVVARLGHPGLAVVTDVVSVDDHTVALICEIAAHGSLAGHIRLGPLPLDEAVDVVVAVAHALAAAHRAGLTHRALHADNVLLGADGPIVADLVQANATGRPRRAPDPTTADVVDLARLALGLPDITEARAATYVATCRAAEDGRITTMAAFADAMARVGAEAAAPVPTPPAPEPAPTDARSLPRSSRLGAVAAGAMVVGAGLGVLATIVPAADADRGSPRTTGPAEQVVTSPAPAERPAWSEASAELTVMTEAGPARYRIGEPGDHLLIGDWDCDGQETPAIHRPSTGETFLFEAWAEDEVETAVPGDVLAIGSDAVVRSTGSCDRIVPAETGVS